MQNLEDRTLLFSKEVILICKELPNNRINVNLIDQLIRSATSVGANYREANDSLSKKDFLNRLKIARKEAKETSYWLDLLIEVNSNLKDKLNELRDECLQLRKILSSIVTKCSN